MDEKDRQSALTTEHFVLQAAANTSTSEAGARASIYILSLSSALVAMGVRLAVAGRVRALPRQASTPVETARRAAAALSRPEDP